MSSPLQRIAENLKGMSTAALQVAQSATEKQKVVKNRPGLYRKMAQISHENGKLLDEWADEDETMAGHNEEDIEALVTISRRSGNVSTLLGLDGRTLEILTHTDPDYVLGVLTRASEEARREAISRMPVEEKAKWLRWLGGGGLETLDKIGQIALKQIDKETDKIIARWKTLVEKLPEGILTEEEKKEFTDFSEEALKNG